MALGTYIPADGLPGVLLASFCLILAVLLLRRPRLPTAVILLLIGAIYALLRGAAPGMWTLPDLVSVPSVRIPSGDALWTGFILLALPQIPLSLGNAMLATRQLADDWFPERKITLRKIGTSYSLFNIGAALFGGVPVCHGSGGMAGHYAFGARTGGSVAVYGAFFILLGGAGMVGFNQVDTLFPLPVLGVILCFEAWTLLKRIKGLAGNSADLAVALVVVGAAVCLPNGFLIGMIIGGLMVACRRFRPNIASFFRDQAKKDQI